MSFPSCRSPTFLTIAYHVSLSAQVGVLFLQALNHFQRYAYVRQAHAREKRVAAEQQQYQQQQQPPQQQSYGSSFNRTYSSDRMVTPTINGVF